MLWVLNGLN